MLFLSHYPTIPIPLPMPEPGTLAHFDRWLAEYRRKRQLRLMRSARRIGKIAIMVYSHASMMVFGLAAGFVFGLAL